ncbi:MAG: MFS transporter [Rhizobiaceae bacterium]|nr:MFS transporter [Rhizobiaceae bacterium]
MQCCSQFEGTAAIAKVFEEAPSYLPVERRARAFAGALLCNALEWYDFAIYGILALNISQAFFPQGDPTVAMLAALAVFGITFVVRPIGALLLGGLGDRRGRKPALLITAAMMATGTVMIGLMPTYESVGILAPILLLVARLLQGLSAGGEWGATNSFLIEWAPSERRGFWTSFMSLTVALGSGLASAIAAILVTFLEPAEMSAWGWRIPFLLGGLLGIVSFWLRSGLDETPAYIRSTRAHKGSANQGARSKLRPFLTVFGITIHWTVCYYMFLIYLPILTRSHGQVTPAQSAWSNTISTIVIIALVPFIGLLSDRYGRRPFMMASCALVLILAIPAFWLIGAGSGFGQIIGIQMLFGVAIAFYSGAAPAVVAEQFATAERSRWSSVSYAIAAAVFGGFAPFVSVWLTDHFDSVLAPVAYVLVASTASFLVVWFMPETSHLPLD